MEKTSLFISFFSEMNYFYISFYFYSLASFIVCPVERRIEDLYLSIRSLPRGTLIVSFSILSSLVLSLEFLFLMDCPLSLDLLTYSFVLVLLSTLLSAIVVSLLARADNRNPLLNLRRSLYLSIYSNAVIFILWAISGNQFTRSLFSISLESAYSFSIASPILIRLIVISTLLSINPLLQFIGASINSFTLLILGFSLLHSESSLLTGLIISLLLQIFLYIIFKSFVSYNIEGVENLELMKGFLFEWAENVPTYIEEKLSQLSQPEKIEVSYILFQGENGKMKGGVIIPSLHPGPFRNVGSSNLSYQISRKLEKLIGGVFLVFHGAATHRDDAPSSKEVVRLIRDLSRAVKKEKKFISRFPYPNQHRNLFNVTTFPTHNLSFSFISQLNSDAEDISHNVAEYLEEKIGTNLTLIDLHNNIGAEGKPITLGDTRVSVLEKIVPKTLNVQRARQVKVGMAKVRDTGITRKEGMGPDGVSVTLIDYGDLCVVLLLYDANNMIPELRETLERYVQRYLKENGGYRNVIPLVGTTDTHTVTAIGQGVTYHPLGNAVDHEKVLNATKRCLNKAISNLGKSKYAVNRIYTYVKVLGENYNILKNVVVHGVSSYKSFMKFIVPTVLFLNLLLLSMFSL